MRRAVEFVEKISSRYGVEHIGNQEDPEEFSKITQNEVKRGRSFVMVFDRLFGGK